MEEYSWEIDPADRMMIRIKHRGARLFSIFLGEAMESAGRKNIMAHVKECDRSPWLNKWTDEVMDEEVRILQGRA